MKLRNKKTGEIWDIGKVLTCDYPSYDSLEQINEEWEDVPKESLIRDEKIRKAVRAWAELCGIDRCYFEHNDGSFASKWYVISLPTSKHGEDIDSGTYTIAELCGEEEETGKQTPQGGMFEDEK